MKIGCCLNMVATAATKIGDEHIPLFAELNYDYIELPLAQVMDLSDEEFAALGERVGAGGIPLEACNNFFPATHRLTGEKADHAAALDYARRALGRAAKLGAEVVVLGSSGAKNIPEGYPYEKAHAQFVDLLGRLQDIAAPLGITVVVEPLNRRESNFVNTVAEGLAIVREVAKPNIRLLADFYHVRMEEEPLAAIREAGDSLRHIHIAAREGRVFPKPGDGEDYPAFFTALRGAGYDGRVSVEAFSPSVREDAVAALALLRPLA